MPELPNWAQPVTPLTTGQIEEKTTPIGTPKTQVAELPAWAKTVDKAQIVSTSPTTDVDRVKQLEDMSVASGDPVAFNNRFKDVVADSELTGVSQSALALANPHLKNLQSANTVYLATKQNVWDRIGRSWDIGWIQNQLGELGYQYVLTGDQTILNKMTELAETMQEEPAQSLPERAARSAARMMPMMLTTAEEAAGVGSKVAVSYGLTALLMGQVPGLFGLPEEVATVPVASALGLTVGSISGGFEASLRKEAGLAVSELMRIEGIDPGIARATAFGIGAINGAIEVSQLGMVVKSIPGLNKLFSKALLETVTSQTVKRQLANLAKRQVKFVAGETAQEIAQESVNIVVTELGKKINNAIKDTDIDPVRVGEVIDTLANTAVESALGFAVIGVLGTAARVAKVRRPKAAEITPEQIEAVQDRGVIVLGVNENEQGDVIGLTLADPDTGETFETGPEPKPAEIRQAVQEARGSGQVDDAITDIVEGDEDIAEVADEIFEETPAIEGPEIIPQPIDDIIGREDISQEDIDFYNKESEKIDQRARQILEERYDTEDRKAAKDALKKARQQVDELLTFQSQKEAVKLGGLSLEQALVDFSQEVLKQITRTRPGVLSRKSTIAPDEFAADNGYESVEAMFEDWLQAGKKSDAIARLARDIFEEEHARFAEQARDLTAFDDFVDAQQQASRELEQDPRFVPRPDKQLRQTIREQTGQVKPDAQVSERQALKAAFTKAAQAARQAFREGKKEGTAIQKQRMKEAVEKVKAQVKRRVEKVLTEREKVKRRRTSVRNIRDFLGLTDAQMKRVSRKDPRLMTDSEFKKFKDDLLLRATELAEQQQAKLELMATIREKRLQNVDNYRQVLGFPSISNMTTAELQAFTEVLEGFEDGDAFITKRELETVDKTDIRGVRTWREVKEKLANETGVSIEALEKIKIGALDRFRWDSVLVEQSPLHEVLVTNITRVMIEANLRAHEIENKVFSLAKKIKKKGIVDRLLPRDSQIFDYLEASDDLKEIMAQEMSAEQLDLAHLMEEYFSQALNYLIEVGALEKGRENYFTHMRRTFLETLRDDDLMKATKDLFKNYEQDQMVFEILDDDTGNILPLNKFFQFSLRRTGELTPSQNVIKVFLNYVNTFEKKVALDRIIPKMDIYARALTPQRYTPRGLETDRSIKKFVNQYINNKKGRHISFDSVVKQGGEIDLAISAARTFTTMMDLGLNIPVGIASFAGEQSANFIALGAKDQVLGTARMKTKKGKAILEKYEVFTGRSTWEEFTAPGKQFNERLAVGLFGLFHVSTVIANKQFLLGSITKEEYDSGIISSKRLTEIQLEMGRVRVVPGTHSLVGSTSPGKAFTQYRTWAVPLFRTASKDLTSLISNLARRRQGALTNREAREVYRIVGLLSTAAIVGMMAIDEDDNSFIGQLIRKVYRETMSVLQSADPRFWTRTARVVKFLQDLSDIVVLAITMEEFKTKKGLKAVSKAEKTFTPRVIKQFQKDEKK